MRPASSSSTSRPRRVRHPPGERGHLTCPLEQLHNGGRVIAESLGAVDRLEHVGDPAVGPAAHLVPECAESAQPSGAYSIKRRLSDHNTLRLYSYQDLLALLVVSALRIERDMSLQTIRRVVRHLRSRGYNEPLREVKFATVGREIYFQHPDGTWEGDLQPDQIILEEVIRLDPLRSAHLSGDPAFRR